MEDSIEALGRIAVVGWCVGWKECCCFGGGRTAERVLLTYGRNGLGVVVGRNDAQMSGLFHFCTGDGLRQEPGDGFSWSSRPSWSGGGGFRCRRRPVEKFDTFQKTQFRRIEFLVWNFFVLFIYVFQVLIEPAIFKKERFLVRFDGKETTEWIQ